MDPVIILYSLFGPFLVWPVEYFFPYPYIIEELFKVFVVWQGDKNYKNYIIAGVLFALSETVLYTININITGGIGLMITRFLTSSILHSATFLIIYLSAKRDRKFIWTGFLAAAAVHYLYNLFI